MPLNSIVRYLISVTILNIFVSVALASTDTKNNDIAPAATSSEIELSFWDLPYLEEAFIDTTPLSIDKHIVVGELGVDGGNKEKVLALAQEIAEQSHGLIDSLLISQHGKLLFESYYLRGRINLPHMQASTTKSYVSLAVGRAIQLGYLTMADLDKPLVSFLNDIEPSKFIEGADLITLHKALTMRSGMRISREQLAEFKENPNQLKGQGQIETFFENSPSVTSESQVFHYQSVDPRLVMQVLEAAVPGTVKDFIKVELLDKMGITTYTWRDDDSGLPMAPYGSNMTSRNMIKWGTLISDNGKWNGEQLISEAYMTKATNRIVHPKDEDVFFVGDRVTKPGYGYYFWQADMKIGDKTYFSQSAQGGGGQYIILIEALDLIVVFTAHEREDRTMQIMANHILPAFVKLKSLATSLE